MASKVNVRLTTREHHYATMDGPETVWAAEPVTAQELLTALIEQATAPCRRPSCEDARRRANTADYANKKLAEVTAERDALERLLTKRVNAW